MRERFFQVLLKSGRDFTCTGETPPTLDKWVLSLLFSRRDIHVYKVISKYTRKFLCAGVIPLLF
jgi:hypothetical protein